ncbi:glycoside hydrolase family 9 protein [Nonomuraea sp. NPDC059194]|uniref:glycoside hydrolase family 9 protein n=1 Tax=Nonomuraea sp. NPDC059194 TaxID=3346764 RepID=UPI0036B987B6
MNSLPFRVICAVAVVGAVLPAVPAQADTIERLANGAFDAGTKAPWWSSGNTPSAIDAGRLCADVPAGTVNVWDAMIGQGGIPFESGQPYKLTFRAVASKDVKIRPVAQMGVAPYTAVVSGWSSVTTSAASFTYTGTSTVDFAEGQVLFQVGGAKEPYRLCLDDISFTGGTSARDGRNLGSPVRVNQLGYLSDGPKRATIVNASTQPLTWRLVDKNGATADTGQTRVHGNDAMSGDHVHIADFSDFGDDGSYRLEVAGQRSVEFRISGSLYGGLRADALAYFYHNRSGIPIEAEYVGAAYARPAGHLGVAPNKGDGAQWGGWYDAGDHGKYVVNGALAAWQLIDAYEQSGNVKLSIPEAGGALPDILDEAKWQLDFLLRMQREDGLVHHKIHDADKWTGIPMAPQDDPQPRKLFAPSTAATLNLAAVGARCARVYRAFDAAFAGTCLDAAKLAWRAALAHPAIYAEKASPGGGAYDDNDVTDEFSWAAAELYTATGNAIYLDKIKHTLHTGNFSWRMTGGLADLALARVPTIHVPPSGATKAGLVKQNPRYGTARTRIVGAADRHLADLRKQGYANPDLPGGGKYFWGSTSATANRAMVIALAYELTKDPKYRDGALESLDYLLGRNALNQSYVTGYGERASKNQHHRFWAHQLKATLPNPAPGSLAGGPNSDLSTKDPATVAPAERILYGCAPAKCYVDDINSYATNEVAINWNSALAWMAAFADTV